MSEGNLVYLPLDYKLTLPYKYIIEYSYICNPFIGMIMNQL